MCDSLTVHRLSAQPENVLLSHKPGDGSMPTLLITDFGLSRLVAEGKRAKTICGTPFYMAPEVLEAHRAAAGYGPAADMWSAGVLLFRLLTGTELFNPPRGCRNPRKWIRDHILAAQEPRFRLHLPHFIGPHAANLLGHLVCGGPRRWSADRALNHAWFRGEEGLRRQQSTLVLTQETVILSQPPLASATDVAMPPVDAAEDGAYDSVGGAGSGPKAAKRSRRGD